MNTKLLVVLIALILTSVNSYADEVPKIVIDGLTAYKTSGYEEAFNVWLKGSPMESDKTTTMKLKGGFTQIETFFGKMIGFNILKNFKISSMTTRVYLEADYEKGPLFVYFDCYNSARGWIISMMKFHTEADKILPMDVLLKEK